MFEGDGLAPRADGHSRLLFQPRVVGFGRLRPCAVSSPIAIGFDEPHQTAVEVRTSVGRIFPAALRFAANPPKLWWEGFRPSPSRHPGYGGPATRQLTALETGFFFLGFCTGAAGAASRIFVSSASRSARKRAMLLR